MTLNAQAMAEKIKAYMTAIAPVQGSDAAAAQAYRDEQLVAMCQGIIDEIKDNAVVTTISGAPDGEHMGKIA